VATTLNKAVVREVHSRTFGPIVVKLTPEGFYLREKGRRTAFLLDYGHAYQHAVMMDVASKRLERKVRRG
jgi:hypothetical protein